jgi:hypothetical protein
MRGADRGKPATPQIRSRGRAKEQGYGGTGLGLAISPQARAQDGRRRDRGERAGQGLGIHGAPALRDGCTLTPPQHTSDLVRFFMTPWAPHTQTGQPG